MKKTLSLSLAFIVIFASFCIFPLVGSAANEIVQDGLVHWYDGATHSADGKTWTDKKGSKDITECVGTFVDDAYVLEPGEMQNLPIELYQVLGGDEYTLELNMGEFKGEEGMTYVPFMCNNNGSTAEKFALYIQTSNGKFFVKTSGLASSARPNFENGVEKLQNATLAVTYKNGGSVKVYVNGELVVEGNAPASNGNTGTTFMIGNDNNKKRARFEYEGMRFYDKELTAEQVKNNADVDNQTVVEPQAEKIKITPYKYGGTWENWVNSPNNPNGEGQQPGVTQLLMEIFDNSDQKIDIADSLTWKLTIAGGGTSKTVTLSPATKYTGADYILYRFETCMATGANQFIPVNGTDYTVTVQVYDGEVLKYESDPTEGFTCSIDPVVPEGPKGGENTAFIAILSVIALFGAGVVVTKKILAK